MLGDNHLDISVYRECSHQLVPIFVLSGYTLYSLQAIAATVFS